eukprot:CAMPEP_0119005114 /NCGR_PEP_ID=MMETSP1176-20130426/1535_1 /TAXON_ID=265551 /ORGANISM="Synedropsis recta cf, Strain CCMP1620" /LENGTH=433 /DNA_ID=CAMNT_0006956883 /DNA_START=28 /DNA_END=1329 /DNA_ORIENTATION=-
MSTPPQVTHFRFVDTSEIKPEDVLLGKGGPSGGHVGTIAFKALVQSRLDSYRNANCTMKNGKNILTLQVVHLIHLSGGRFLTTDAQPTLEISKRWYVLDSMVARIRVREFFREYIKNVRKHRRPCALLDKIGISGMFCKNSTYTEIISYVATCPRILDFLSARHEVIEKRKQKLSPSSCNKNDSKKASSCVQVEALPVGLTNRAALCCASTNSMSSPPAQGILTTRPVPNVHRPINLPLATAPPAAALSDTYAEKVKPPFLLPISKYKAAHQKEHIPVRAATKKKGTLYYSSSITNGIDFSDEEYLVGITRCPPLPQERRPRTRVSTGTNLEDIQNRIMTSLVDAGVSSSALMRTMPPLPSITIQVKDKFPLVPTFKGCTHGEEHLDNAFLLFADEKDNDMIVASHGAPLSLNNITQCEDRSCGGSGLVLLGD